MNTPKFFLAAALAFVLAACADKQALVKPDLPTACAAVQPTVVTVERLVYVSIPEELTKPAPIAEGPIAQCFAVGAERKRAIKEANARFQEISEIEGTEVKKP